MVASRQVEIPYYRAVERQRGRGFGAVAQVVERTAVPFLRKFVVPAAKRIGADMLEFAVPEIAEVPVVERTSGRLQRVWESKLWENNWVKGKGAAGGREAGKGLQAESFQQKILNNPVGHEETILQTVLVEHVEQQFSVLTYCGSVWNSWRESPNC